MCTQKYIHYSQSSLVSNQEPWRSLCYSSLYKLFHLIICFPNEHSTVILFGKYLNILPWLMEKKRILNVNSSVSHSRKHAWLLGFGSCWALLTVWRYNRLLQSKNCYEKLCLFNGCQRSRHTWLKLSVIYSALQSYRNEGAIIFLIALYTSMTMHQNSDVPKWKWFVSSR